MTAVMDLPSLKYTHDQLLVALEARRKWAERLDAKALAKHQRDEAAYLKSFRSACRDALKWNYDKVKANYGQVEIQPGRKFRSSDAPTCPMSLVVKLNAAIKFVKSDTRKNMTLSRNGEWASIYWLLTYDPDAPKAALC